MYGRLTAVASGGWISKMWTCAFVIGVFRTGTIIIPDNAMLDTAVILPLDNCLCDSFGDHNI